MSCWDLTNFFTEFYNQVSMKKSHGIGLYTCNVHLRQMKLLVTVSTGSNRNWHHNFTPSGRPAQHLRPRGECTGSRLSQRMRHPFYVYQTVLCFLRFPLECVATVLNWLVLLEMLCRYVESTLCSQFRLRWCHASSLV